MNRISGYHTNVIFHHTDDRSYPVLELVINFIEESYTLEGCEIVQKPKLHTVRLAGIGAENIRNFGQKLIEEADRVAELSSVERGAVKLAGENKVLRDLLGEAHSLIDTIDPSETDEWERMKKLMQQIESARYGKA
jgi:hypothetical protein